MMTFRLKWLILLCIMPGYRLLSQAAAPVSELQLISSDPKLEHAFIWAKAQALAYAHEGGAIGPWYEAALPGRNAFCMRDVSHQTSGAAALGLFAANRNMLHRFAAAIAPQRDWAGYWEIDRFGHPSTADYANDDDFWYNLPANFDLLDATVRMWRWTGDGSLLNGKAVQQLFQSTSESYIKAWQLDAADVLSRPRIMNQRHTSGQFVHSRGIPSYTEGKDDFSVGTDLLAAEYRALKDLGFLAMMHGKKDISLQYETRANSFLDLLERKAWSQSEHHFAGTLAANGSILSGSGDVMILYFEASHNPAKIKEALSTVESPAFRNKLGIEEESYIPQILYRYRRKAAAYDTIMDLSSPTKQRREYPEVSFSVIAALVTGMMGVDVTYDMPSKSFVLQSLAELPNESNTTSLRNLRIQKNIIDIQHTGDLRTSLTNRSGPSIRWRAEFSGEVSVLRVGNQLMRTQISKGLDGNTISSVVTKVPPGAKVTVSQTMK